MEREEAARLLAEAGIHDGFISRHTVWELDKGHTMVLYELCRWGQDPGNCCVLGTGQTLQQAVSNWQNNKARGRRGT